MTSYSSNGASHGPGNHGTQDPSSQGAPDYNLSGVLHFLQSEWRRYEHDRNTWAIERAELRVRVYTLTVRHALHCSKVSDGALKT